MNKFNETTDHNKRMSMICKHIDSVQEKANRKIIHDRVLGMINK